MRLNHWILGFVAWIFVTGCATTHTDWNNRLGSYSYDQAVVDMGPPDKATNFPDGTVIAQWYTTKRVSFGFGAGVSSGPIGGGIGGPVGEDMKVTQLTFGPDGVLQSASTR